MSDNQNFFPGQINYGQPDTLEKSVWLSLVDFLLGFFGSLILALAVALPILYIGSDDIAEPAIGALLIAGLFQQSVQFFAPLIISKHSFGPIKDWRFKFEKFDILYGAGIATCLVLVGNLVLKVVSNLVNLQSLPPSNTAILTDSQGSIWVVVAVFVAVIGAPITEELLFRGLVLRIFEGISAEYLPRIIASSIGVLLSTIFFTILHSPDTSNGWEAFVVFQSVIFVLGLGFGISAIVFNRLGPGIFGHMFFNGVTVFSILFLAEDTEALGLQRLTLFG